MIIAAVSGPDRKKLPLSIRNSCGASVLMTQGWQPSQRKKDKCQLAQTLEREPEISESKGQQPWIKGSSNTHIFSFVLPSLKLANLNTCVHLNWS